MSQPAAARTPFIAPVAVLATTLLLLPSVGSITPLLVQDTLKSALLAIGVLIAAGLCVRQRRRANLPMQIHLLVLPPLLLMLYALGSMLWSHHYLAGSAASHWFVVGTLVWLSTQTLTRTTLPGLLLALHAGACAASLWAGAQFWFDLSWFPQGPGPAATFFNRNFFAEYAVCALPFSVWLLTMLRSKGWRYCMALSLALNLSAILMTGTRSALLALAATLPLLLLLVVRQQRYAHATERRQQLRLMALFVLALAILVNIPSHSPHILAEAEGATAWQRSVARAGTLTQAATFTDGSFSVRRQLWMATLRMVQANPWRGVGAGAWEIHAPLYQDADTTMEIDYYAHNEYLQLASEYGLPMAVLVLAIVAAYLLKTLSRVIRAAPGDAPLRAQRAFSLITLLAVGIVSAAGFPWHLASTASQLALALGLLGAADLAAPDSLYSSSKAWSIRARWQWPLQITLLAALLLAVAVSERAIRAEHLFVHALQAAYALPRNDTPLSAQQQASKDAMLVELRAAIALNPHYRQFIPLAAEVMANQHDWTNARWILQSTIDSRPNVYALWLGLAQATIQLHAGDDALNAWHHLQLLRPQASATRAIGIAALSVSGHDAAAKVLLEDSLAHAEPGMDYEILQSGYALGLKWQDQALAVRALTLRNTYWPQQAADGYFRIGLVYAQTPPRNDALALQAFTHGLRSVPVDARAGYRQQVPLPYRQQLPP